MGITDVEWIALKARYNNKCAACCNEKINSALLEKAHVLAKSKGGTQIIPLCPSCHKEYDKFLMPADKLKKIGVPPELYVKMLPNKSGPKPSQKSDSDEGSFYGNIPTKKPSSKKSTKKPSNFDDMVGGRGLY